MTIGTLHPPDTLFLRVHVGEATDEKTGDKYEMSLNAGGGAPLIYSEQSKRFYSINWHEIIELARKAGIDDT